MQDLNDKITGNSLTAAEWNEIPSEIQNVIEGLGITLSGGDLNQLGKAIAGYVANGDFYTDGGAADAYVLSVIGSKQAPTAYTDGLQVRFIAANANTGAATVNVAGLGVKSIKVLGADPAAGDIDTGRVITLAYNSGLGWFETVFLDNLRTSPEVAKAWVNFNGTGTVAIRDSHNVSSITDVNVGLYTVNLTNAMDSTDFATPSNCAGATVPVFRIMTALPSSASAVDIAAQDIAGTETDTEEIHLSVFGTLA